MATVELSDLSSKEEIAAYADQVVKEVREERAGEKSEKKPDAQIVSETAGKPAHDKTPAEKDSGSDTAPKGEDTAEAEGQGDDTGNEDSSWLDEDLKAEATAFGIDESELADFTSREELERALRLFDKSALEAGRKALAESDGEGDKATVRNEKGQFAKKDEPKAEPPAKRDGQYEFKLNTDTIWDEEAAKDLTTAISGLRDHYDSRLALLEERLLASEARFEEADAIAKERHFDNLVDSLGHADLFGKTDKETPKEKERRTDLFVEVETYLKGREVLGRPTELTEAVVNRVARSLFADELGKKELKQRTRKISKQSNGRQGGGATRPQDPREDPRDEADRLYRELSRS